VKLRSHQELIAELRSDDPSAVREFERASREHFRQARLESFGIGQQIADRRREMRVSQRDLAARADIPQAEISRIERGLGNPTLLTLARLAEALHLEVSLQAKDHTR
jgi:DNA-binding XRE family transcriptional regulator